MLFRHSSAVYFFTVMNNRGVGRFHNWTVLLCSKIDHLFTVHLQSLLGNFPHHCETGPSTHRRRASRHCLMRGGGTLHCGTVSWQWQNESWVNLLQRGGEMPQWHFGRMNSFPRCWTPLAETVKSLKSGVNKSKREWGCGTQKQQHTKVFCPHRQAVSVSRQHISKLFVPAAGPVVFSPQTNRSRVSNGIEHLRQVISARLFCSAVRPRVWLSCSHQEPSQR